MAPCAIHAQAKNAQTALGAILEQQPAANNAKAAVAFAQAKMTAKLAIVMYTKIQMGNVHYIARIKLHIAQDATILEIAQDVAQAMF